MPRQKQWDWRTLEIRSLRVLIAVADHGSFAAAGNAVGLSQSAISLQIKNLEDRLGRRLFDRKRRPPMINAEGRALVEQAREIVEKWDLLADAFKAEPVAGSLGLGALPTIITGVLPRALSRLRKENPRLRIRLTTGLSHELEQLLQKERLDAAVVTQPREIARGFRWHPFAVEPLVVIAPADAKGKDDRSLLEGLPFVRFRRYAWAGQLIDGEINRRGIAVKPQMEIDSLEGIALLVGQGLGVSVIPRRKVDEPFPKSIRAVPFGKPQISRTLGLLEPTGNPRAGLVRQLLEALRAESGNRKGVPPT